MTTKTDLVNIALTNSEITAASAKGAQPNALLGVAKQQASELAVTLAEIVRIIPAGSNATALSAIRTSLL